MYNYQKFLAWAYKHAPEWVGSITAGSLNAAKMMKNVDAGMLITSLSSMVVAITSAVIIHILKIYIDAWWEKRQAKKRGNNGRV